jgi:CubicO group peptidase (beta-lactamase class C family)
MKTARGLSLIPVLSSILLMPATQSAAQEAFMKPAANLEEYAKNVGESVRWVTSSAAATMGLNLCSGLWEGGLTREIIDRDLNGRDPAITLLPGKLDTVIDEKARTIAVSYEKDMPPRYVVWRPVLGCVQLPVGASLDASQYLPQVPADVRAPDLDNEAWPMGDRNAMAKLPKKPRGALQKVVDAAFDQNAYGGVTWGVVVVKDGKIVAEKYDRGFDMHMGSQTHSAAKSFTSSVIGIAIGEGYLKLKEPAPLKVWRRPGDPRGTITIENLLHMASGLYSEGHGSPNLKIYFLGGAVADLDPTNVLDSMPGTRFVYSPPDTQMLMRSLREAMNDDDKFHAYPFRELYWKIGMTRTTTNSDWNGDFLASGQTWSSARDFARFGLLYVNDGMWLGKRVLPEGWAEYVRTKAPAQPPRAPYYGAQFWIFGGMSGLPEDAFSPIGGQGHYSMIIPSRKVVVVRRGFDAPGSGFKIDQFSADVLKALDTGGKGAK